MKNSLLTGIAVLLFILNVQATKHTINASGTSFNPNNIPSVFVGDTIHWVRISGSHTTTSTTIPGGAATWDSPLNVNTPSFDYTVTVAGVYNYKCIPHESFGMTGTFTATYDCNTLNCDDTDACTTDSCSAQDGCISTPITCDDSDTCTTDACVNGVCEFTLIAECNVGINDVGSLIQLSFFPNPMQDKLTIEVVQASLARIVIADISGKQMLSRQLSGKETLDVRHFAPGVYFIRLTTENKTAAVKLMKE